jgi:hypothetical protein
MLTVYFNNFYQMSKEEYDVYINFFKLIFNKEIVKNNNKDSDILCESVFGNQSYINYKKYKYSFLISFENRLINEIYLDKFSCILSGFTKLNNMIILPYFYWRLFETSIKILEPINKIPTKNICAVISNGISIRNNILKKLHNNIHIDFGGRFMNNIPKVSGFHYDNNLIEFYKQYKFGIAFENSIGDYYITEKIFNILKAGIIPIYFGTTKINEYINPKRFIQIKDDSDIEINRIVNIINNMTDLEYIKIINEPVLLKPFDITFNKIISDIQNKLL